MNIKMGKLKLMMPSHTGSWIAVLLWEVEISQIRAHSPWTWRSVGAVVDKPEDALLLCDWMCRCQAANDDLWKRKGHTAAEWVSFELDWLLKTLYLVRKEREEGNLSITCLLAGDTEGVVSQSDLPLARHTLSQRRKWIFHQLNCTSKPPDGTDLNSIY